MVAINGQWFKPISCKECQTEFKPKSSVHVFCSQKCREKSVYTTGRVTTDGQYQKVSGDWYRYLQKLCYKTGREKLSIEILLELLEKQQYLCAVSGMPLTCQLKRGTVNLTNVSIDRIIPGGSYSLDNIRLVCRIVNIMKWSMLDEDLYAWCKRILNHANI